MFWHKNSMCGKLWLTLLHIQAQTNCKPYTSQYNMVSFWKPWLRTKRSRLSNNTVEFLLLHIYCMCWVNSHHERRREDECERRGDESEGELHYQSPRNAAPTVGQTQRAGGWGVERETRSDVRGSGDSITFTGAICVSSEGLQVSQRTGKVIFDKTRRNAPG